MLKTYAIWLAGPKKAIGMFRAQEDEHLNRLTQYEQIKADLERECGSMPPPDSPFFGDYATLQRGISYEREYTNWCRWMIEQFDHYLS